MITDDEGGFGCPHCNYTGWVWDGTEHASSGPDPTPYVDPTPCPYCSCPEEPEWTPSDDDWGMASDFDQDEAVLEGVAIEVR